MIEIYNHCNWTQFDSQCEVWTTDCGKVLDMKEGPKQKGMMFCCFCGKRLEEVPAIEEFPFR